MNSKIPIIFVLALIVFLSACITQQQTAENTPQNEIPGKPQTQPEIPLITQPETPLINESPPIVPTNAVSGEFTLKSGESVKNLRGTGAFENKRLELRVKAVVFRQFPMSKIGVFEVLDETGTVITQRDARVDRYLNEDIVSEGTYEPVLLDKIYVKDIIVSEQGNSVTIEVNK